MMMALPLNDLARVAAALSDLDFWLGRLAAMGTLYHERSILEAEVDRRRRERRSGIRVCVSD